jgi:hypothetical protein
MTNWLHFNLSRITAHISVVDSNQKQRHAAQQWTALLEVARERVSCKESVQGSWDLLESGWQSCAMLATQCFPKFQKKGTHSRIKVFAALGEVYVCQRTSSTQTHTHTHRHHNQHQLSDCHLQYTIIVTTSSVLWSAFVEWTCSTFLTYCRPQNLPPYRIT